MDPFLLSLVVNPTNRVRLCHSQVTFERLDTSKLGFAVASAKIARIDTNHSNPHAAWLMMGSVNYPTPAQQVILREASQLKWAPLTLGESVALPPHGTMAIVFSK